MQKLKVNLKGREEKVVAEYRKGQQVVDQNHKEYNQDCVKLVDFLEKYFAKSVLDTVSENIVNRNFRAVERELKKLYSVNNNLAVVDTFSDVLKGLRFKPNERDFGGFMEIFNVLVEILNSIEVTINETMKTHHLKNCMSECQNEWNRLKTLYNDIKSFKTDKEEISYELYVEKLSEVYNDIMIAKRKRTEEQAIDQNRAKRYNNQQVTAVESQYSSNNYNNNNSSGGRGHSGGRGNSNFRGGKPGRGRNGSGHGGPGRGANRDGGINRDGVVIRNDHDADGTSYYDSNSSSDKHSHITCFKCHQLGHYANKCPSNNNGNVNNLNAASDGSRGLTADTNDKNTRNSSTGTSNVSLSEQFQTQNPKPNSGRNGTGLGNGN